MDTLELRELNSEEMETVNGGYGWACVTLIVTEVVDAITSNGKNLEEAYENGRSYGESL